MATIAPLAYQLPPFWHPLSVVIHLGDILVIDSNQKQLHLVSNELIEGGEISESPTPHINNGTNNNISARKRSLSITYHGEYLPERNEIDQYVNDVFQVFGKIFYSPEFSSNLKYKKQLESIGYELSNFLKTLFQIYYGNLSAMKKYHDESHVPMFVKKAITTFSHPCFTSSFTGVEVSLHFTVILGSLLRLAGWDSKFLDQSIYTSIMSTAEDFTSTWNNSTLLTPFKSNTSTDTATHESKKLLVTTPNNTSITISPGGISSTSHIHADLATAIAMNFKSKSMDKWAQFALTLGANASTLDDLRRLLTTNSNNNGSGAVASTSASMYTSSLSLSNKTNTTILPRYSFIESIKLSGSIVAQMLWSRSQTQLFQELVGDTVAAYLTALDRERAGPAEFSTGSYFLFFITIFLPPYKKANRFLIYLCSWFK